MKTKRLAALSALPLLLFVGAIPQQTAKDTIDANKLVHAFQTNELNADDTFAGKQVKISGSVARVVTARHSNGPGSPRQYVVELEVKQLPLSVIALQCHFEADQHAALTKLKHGDPVVLSGTCARLTVYSGNHEGREKDYLEIHVNDCHLVAP